MYKRIGNYSFIIGVIIAVVLGLFLPIASYNSVIVSFIFIFFLALIIGFLNILPETVYNISKSKQLKNLFNNTLVIYVSTSVSLFASYLFYIRPENLLSVEPLSFLIKILLFTFITILIIYAIITFVYLGILHFTK